VHIIKKFNLIKNKKYNINKDNVNGSIFFKYLEIICFRYNEFFQFHLDFLSTLFHHFYIFSSLLLFTYVIYQNQMILRFATKNKQRTAKESQGHCEILGFSSPSEWLCKKKPIACIREVYINGIPTTSMYTK